MFYPLSLSLLLISTALAPSVITGSHASQVICGNLALLTPRAMDCYILIQQLQHTDWFTRRTIFGNFAPEPGKTPKSAAFESCRFYLGNTASGPQHGQSERIRLADYVALLEEVARDCLAAGSGFTAGTFRVGGRKRFFAVLGGAHDIVSEGRMNGTLVGGGGVLAG